MHVKPYKTNETNKITDKIKQKLLLAQIVRSYLDGVTVAIAESIVATPSYFLKYLRANRLGPDILNFVL